MQVCRSHFKILLLWGVLFLLCLACGNISRDNILDPKNPESARPLRILVEAFVNTENSFEYNQFMLSALDSLMSIYNQRLSIVEYHRNTQDHASDYHLNESELLYQKYLDSIGVNNKGVPDVFINGADIRVQGASSVASALFRLQQALTPVLTQQGLFTIEMSFVRNNNQVIPEITLARLGSSDAQDILVKGVLISQLDQPYHLRVVQEVQRSQVIDRLQHGEQETFTLPEMDVDLSKTNWLVVSVTDEDEVVVYQSEMIRIE